MADGISLPFWTGGVNRMIDASEVWLGLIRLVRVDASEPARVQPETAGHGARPV